MSIDLDSIVSYNYGTQLLEKETQLEIKVIDWDWYLVNVYRQQPAASSIIPTTQYPEERIMDAFAVVIHRMRKKKVGRLKMIQFMQLINEVAEGLCQQ